MDEARNSGCDKAGSQSCFPFELFLASTAGPSKESAESVTHEQTANRTTKYETAVYKLHIKVRNLVSGIHTNSDTLQLEIGIYCSCEALVSI